MDLRDKIVHADNAHGLDSCQSTQSKDSDAWVDSITACNSHRLSTANSVNAKDNGVATNRPTHTDALDEASDCQTMSVFWEVE